MDANGSTRLHVSIDFTLPEPPIRRSRSRILLPLGFIRKGALRKVDTRGPSNQPIPILDSGENGKLATDMLLALARRALPRDVASSKECRSELENVVFSDADHAEAATRQLAEWLHNQPGVQQTETQDVFVAVVEQLATNFLFALEVDAGLVGIRSIVKYSYEDDLPEVRRISIPAVISLDVPQFGMAASWHFEVESPPGLGLRRLSVQEHDIDGTSLREWVDAAPNRDPRTVAHVACRPEHRFTAAIAEVVLTPQPRGLSFVMLIGALLAALLVALALVGRAFPTVFLADTSYTPSASSILLAGPALLLSWLSRASEHVMVARLLWPLRRVLVVSSIVLFGMALLVAVPVASPWRCTGWALVSAAQAWAVVEAISLYRSVVRGA